MRTGVGCLLGLALLGAVAGCGLPPRVALPEGSGQSSADAVDWLRTSTSNCLRVGSLTAELTLSGQIAGRRVRARVLAGTDVSGRVRLEAVAPFGAPLFVLAANGASATLLLPREARVVTGTTLGEVLDALTGLRLDGADLHAALSGCGVADRDPVGGRAYGDRWRAVVLANGATFWIERRASAPRLAVAELPGLWIEYPPGSASLRAVRLVAGAGTKRPRVDLMLDLSQVEENVALGPDAFEVALPADAVSMSIEELRGRGLLAGEVR